MTINALIRWLEAQRLKHGNIEVTIDGEEIKDIGVFHKGDTTELQVLLSSSPAE
jgi:hypothetical protein